MQKLCDFARLNRFLSFFILSGFTIGAWFGFSFLTNRLFYVIPVLALLGFFAKKKGASTLILFLVFFALGSMLFLLPGRAPVGKGEYWGFVIQAKPNYYLFWTQGRRVYVYEKDTLRQIGDVLKIEGFIKDYASTEYEGRFSFGEYLASQGVSQTLIVYSLTEEMVFPLRLTAAHQNYLSLFAPDARALIASLLFNDIDYHHPLFQEASAIGCLYFISFSGLLYSTFLNVLERLLKLKIQEKKAHVIVWIVALFILPFSYGKGGVLRVFFSKSERLLIERGRLPDRPSFSVASDSGVLCLLANPFFAVNTGFLVGLGLSLFSSLSSGLFLKLSEKRRQLARKGFSLAFLLPMLTSHNAIHLLSIVYALLLLPLIAPFAALAFLAYFKVPLVGALNHFAVIIFEWIQVLSKADVVIPFGSVSETLVFVYYLCLTVFLYSSEMGLRIFQKGIIAVLSAGFVINVVPLGNGLTEQVSFVNVGQGDCIIIRDGFTCVMIDTGGNLGFDMAQEVDIPFLRKNRIYRIDCLIASHHDFDHIGAATSLQNRYRVDRFVDKKEAFPLTIGDMTFFNWNGYGGNDENQRSLVLSLNFMNKKWLFTGDAPVDIENRIVDDNPKMDCDVLKVGHHGSDTSSSERFLRTISPEVGIISVGANNKYGHPKSVVIDRFYKLKIPVRRTDQEGTITYRRIKGRLFGQRMETFPWKPSFLLREVKGQDRYNKPDDSIVIFSTKPHG